MGVSSRVLPGSTGFSEGSGQVNKVLRAPWPATGTVKPEFSKAAETARGRKTSTKKYLGKLFEHLQLETFLVGALYRDFREYMRILTAFLGKTHRNPS